MIGVLLAALLAVSSPKCRDCQERPDDRSLLIFMSFSLPLESWKIYSAAAEKAGGTLILRGIPENSFLACAAKIQELREEGVNAPIDIDPSLFEEYRVDSVPVIVVRDALVSDQVEGHFQLEPFLSESASSGDAKAISAAKLDMLRNPQ